MFKWSRTDQLGTGIPHSDFIKLLWAHSLDCGLVMNILVQILPRMLLPSHSIMREAYRDQSYLSGVFIPLSAKNFFTSFKHFPILFSNAMPLTFIQLRTQSPPGPYFQADEVGQLLPLPPLWSIQRLPVWNQEESEANLTLTHTLTPSDAYSVNTYTMFKK